MNFWSRSASVHGRAIFPLSSGGEMQRVAIARALRNSPKMLIADEPTGNLDSGSAEAILNVFRELNRGGFTVCHGHA